MKVLKPDGLRVTVDYNDNLDDNGDRWIIAELNILNATVNDSGCYQCLAANFEHTDNSTSNIIFIESKCNFEIYN